MYLINPATEITFAHTHKNKHSKQRVEKSLHRYNNEGYHDNRSIHTFEIINCKKLFYGWSIHRALLVFHMCAIKRDEKLDNRIAKKKKKKALLREPRKGLCVLWIPLKGFSYLWQVYTHSSCSSWTPPEKWVRKKKSIHEGIRCGRSNQWSPSSVIPILVFSSHYNFTANLVLNQDLQRSR